MRKIFFIFFLSLVVAFGSDLKTLEKLFNETKTLRVSFVQRVKYDWYPKEDESKGIFYAQRGGKFRLEYYSPDRITVISDGSKVYLINHEEKSVYVEPISANTSPVIESLFLLSKPLSEVFDLVSVTRRGNYEVYTLVPLKEDKNIQKVQVYLDSNGEIKKIVSYDKQNTRTEIDFIEVRRNFRPSEEVFRVRIPADYQVRRNG